MTILQTPRLILREAAEGDAAFVLALVNDPDWLRHIGDRQIRTVEAARAYVETGPQAMYRRFGFGLWLVERREDGGPLGLCGLIKRDALDDVDLGFALLAAHRRQGYAFEAAQATMRHARETLALPRLAAIISPANDASRGLLGKLGFAFERNVRLTEDAPEAELHAARLR